MNTSIAVKKMIDFYEGSVHDINHFLKVYSYARTIGMIEGVDSDIQEKAEVAAIVHDIACPLCREKYGNASGKYQELEGPQLAENFLKELGYDNEFIKRICYLVGHHHTYSDVDGLDYQILLEADFLVNADESSLPKENIKAGMDKFFKTKTGKELLTSIYQLDK